MKSNILSKAIKSLIILEIRLYQVCISPFMPKTCRFYPTCSDYFIQSVQKKGPIKGCLQGMYRILRCNPFNEGGYDPVKK